MTAGAETRTRHGGILSTGAVLFAARMSQPLFSFFLFVVAARVLPVEDVGAYAVLMGLLFIFQAGAVLGLGPLVTREISGAPEDAAAWMGAAAAVLLPASLVCLAAFPLTAAALGYGPQTVRGASLLGLGLPFTAGIQIAESVFLATGRARNITLQNFFENILRTAVSVALLFAGFGLVMLLAVHTASRGAACAAGFLLLKRAGIASPRRPGRERLRYMLRRVPSFGLMATGAMIFFRLDVIMVSLLLSEAAAGLYGAAYRFLAVAFLLPDSFIAALFPVLASRLASDAEGMRDLIARVLLVIAAAAVPVCFCVAGIAPWLLPLVMGSGYGESGGMLEVLIFSLPFYSVNGLLGFLLQAGRHEKTATLLVWGSVVLHAVLNVFCIRLLGTPGAAWAATVTAGLVSLAHVVIVERRIFPLQLGRGPVRACLAAGAALCLFVFTEGACAPLRALAPAALYIALLAGAGVVGRDFFHRSRLLVSGRSH